MVSIIKYDELFDYCKWGKEFNSDTKRLLESHDDINILFDNGLFFYYAIKLHNVELFNMLIDYYKQHVLEPAKAQGNDEYNKALFRLSQELESLTRQIDIEDPEIKKVVKKYIKFITQDNDASSDTTSIGDEDVSSLVESDTEDSGCSFNSKEDDTSTHASQLTLENLQKLNESLAANCKLEPNVDLSGHMQDYSDTYNYYEE